MSAAVEIAPIRPWHIPAVTRMVFANMVGVDVDFTQLTGTPLRRGLSYLIVPFYLLTAGRGFLGRRQGETAGCAYFHLRQLSGFVFNVSVNASHRRQGVATELMHHLQQQIRSAGRRWVALHVDRDNVPAQSLYQQLGYRPYHPTFLRASSVAVLGKNSGGRTLETLPRRAGSQHFLRHLHRERETGDPWAAAVVEADYGDTLPSGGHFYAVRHEGKEVGSLWLGDAGNTRQAMLALEPLWWDRTELYEAIHRGIVAADGGVDRGGAVELYLGSSAHQEATLSFWQHLGFGARRRARILMLRSLENGSG
jgi:GNAT superfamily N-acetyltransferase